MTTNKTNIPYWLDDVTEEDDASMLSQNSGNFLILNKNLTKGLDDIIESIYLSILIDQFAYRKGKNDLNNGRFYATHKDVMKIIPLKKEQMIKAKKGLVEKNIISIIFKGIPPKDWFLINSKEVNYLKIHAKLSENSNRRESRRLSDANPDGCPTQIPTDIYNKKQNNKNRIIKTDSSADSSTSNSFGNSSKTSLPKISRNKPPKGKPKEKKVSINKKISSLNHK